MLKNTFWSKSICALTAYAVVFAAIPQQAHAWGLAPESFDNMYRLAQQGKVEALRASIYRGLDINTVNEDGDSGLCVAAKRRDAYTYNAFRAAGANPYHPCVQRIKDYESFVENSRAVSVTATPREAYGVMGKESYVLSSKVWWGLGFLALAGGAVAIAVGGGGGGSKDSGGSSSEKYKSLGTTAATNSKAKILNKTSGQTFNSKNITHTSENKTEVASINLNSSVLQTTDYIDVILKATGGGTYTNQANTILQVGTGVIGMDAVDKSGLLNNGYININSYNASLGMVASESSTAINEAKGIVDGSSANGIDMNFSGYKASNTIVGMYADTGSVIENRGDIKGTAIQRATPPSNQESGNQTSGYTGLISDFFETAEEGDSSVVTASTGTIVGMEAMLINVGNNLKTQTINVNNNAEGTIKLTAGDQGQADREINISLIGMGSFIDDGFMNGSLSLSRTENVILNNDGKIDIQYTGNYTPTNATDLKNGIGGIIGIRADANTNAFNSGSISIKLEGEETAENEEEKSSVDSAVGMQAVHGGNLTNKEGGSIKIVAPESSSRANYGMISTKGSGTVSNLFVDFNQTLLNNGSITVQASNSYGMASFNGGTVQNNEVITLGATTGDSDISAYKYNIALYGYGNSKQALLTNKGTINIYSAASMAMQNDFSGSTKLENQGTINVYRGARGSLVFGGAYSELHNSGTINYYASPSAITSNIVRSGIDVFESYEAKAGIAVMNTKAQTLDDLKNNETNSETSSLLTGAVYNDATGIINLSGTSSVVAMAVETDEGRAYNKGIINIEAGTLATSADSIGMYLSDITDNEAQIINQGQILTNEKNSAAMASDSSGKALMKNDVGAKIQTSTATSNALGMFASNKSNIQNAGTIEIGGDNSTAIYTRGSSTILNATGGVISVGSATRNVSKGFAVFAGEDANPLINNNGTINLWTADIGGGIYALGEATINNNKDINVYTDKTYGIYISSNAAVSNGSDGVITVGQSSKAVQDSYAIYSAGDYKSISNAGTIDFYNNADKAGYAVYATKDSSTENNTTQIINTGKIYLRNDNSTGIYADLGTISNLSPYAFDVLTNKSAALTIAKKANVVNGVDSVINVGSATQAVSKSYGISSTDDAEGKITNNGTINLYSQNADSYAIYAQNKVSVENNKIINSYNNQSAAIYSTGENSVTNNKAIGVIGNNVFGIKSTGTDSVLSAINAKGATINIGQVGTALYGTAISAEAIGTISNLGTITVESRYGYGISAESGTKIENGNETTQGSILMNAINSTAISSGAVNEVSNTGTIALAASSSTGILATSGTSLKNSGTIHAFDSSSTGIKSGAVSDVENRGTIQTDGISSNGIVSTSGSLIVNTTDGAIRLYGNNSTGISSGAVTNVLNEGEILLSEQGGKGIYSLSTGAATIENKGSITLQNGTNSYGIWTASSTAQIINYKDANIMVGLTSSESGAFGIKLDSGRVENLGSIILNASGTAIKGNSGVTLTNGQEGTSDQQGFIQTNRADSMAVDLNAGTVDNYGTIAAVGNNSKAISLKNSSTVNNHTSSTISVSGSGSYGIYSLGAATITNDGSIEAVKNSTAWTTGTTLIETAEGSNITNNADLIANDNSVAINIGHSSTITTAIESRIKVGNDSSGIIAGDVSSLTNEGRIDVGDGTSDYVYAIKYGDSAEVTNSGTLTVGKNGIGIEVGNHSEVNNSGGGIKVGNGEAQYVYAIKAGANSTITNSATLTVGNNGAGIWAGNNSVIDNQGRIIVGNGSSANSRSYAIFASKGGTVTNSNTLIIGKNAQGIYAYDPKSITNNGDIIINGGDSGNAIGINIYLSQVPEGLNISNSGDIIMTGDATDSYAIYLTKNYKLKEIPETDPKQYESDNLNYSSMDWGDITINCTNGTPCTAENVNKDENDAYGIRGKVNGPTYNPATYGGSYSPTSLFGGNFSIMSAVRLINTGNISTPSQDIDFGDGSGNSPTISVGSGGTYSANSFTGTVYADSSIVQDGFEDTYMNENSFVGQDNGINVVSESYLFNAGKKLNSNGGTDVVMSLKPFDETTDNAQMAAYLQRNYAAQKGEKVFNVLKKAGSQSQYEKYLTQEFGLNIIPNLAKQSLDMEQTVGRAVNDKLLTEKSDDERAVANVLAYSSDVDDKGDVSGYKDDVAAIYAFADKAVHENIRAGLGFEYVRTQGDYDVGGGHYNNLFEFYAPIIFSQDNLDVLVKPKVGYARGHYSREAVDSVYKADINEYYYGVDAEVRKNIELGAVEVEPNAGVNVTGLYIDDIKENNDGLKVKDKNVVSVQSYVGADVKKKFEFDERQALSAIVGGKYYHEFGQKYRTKATNADMIGTYDIITNRLQRNFGLISAKAQYDYRQFSISASVNAPLKKDENIYYLFNVGYGF